MSWHQWELPYEDACDGHGHGHQDDMGMEWARVRCGLIAGLVVIFGVTLGPSFFLRSVCFGPPRIDQFLRPLTWQTQ